MIRRPPRSTLDRSSAASDVYKRQVHLNTYVPYVSTLTVLVALFTLPYVAMPGPLVFVHVPVPVLATPVNVNGFPAPIPHTLPPLPALATGCTSFLSLIHISEPTRQAE